MKKILLPTDFSENAFSAIEYAVQLFRDEKCTFFLLNTYTPAIFDNEYVNYSANIPNMNEIHEKESLAKLQRIIINIRKYHPNKNHIFKKIASFNLLITEIKQQVLEKKIDMVVMGTQGATGANQILFGTHTVHAINTAKCPVLAIPELFEFEEPQNILFPTDFGVEPSEFELKVMKGIASSYKSKIHVLHVLERETLSAHQQEAKKKLLKEIKNIPHEVNIVKQEEVSRAIYDFQENNSIDMLVMINNKHSFFQNLFFTPLVNKIGFHTKIPFLVIPSERIRT